jgi:hypothetical protein
VHRVIFIARWLSRWTVLVSMATSGFSFPCFILLADVALKLLPYIKGALPPLHSLFEFGVISKNDVICTYWKNPQTVSLDWPKKRLLHTSARDKGRKAASTDCAWSRIVEFRESKLNSVELVRERTIPTERSPLVGEVSAYFSNRGCHVVSLTDPYRRNLGFLHRSRYFFFQVAPQFYSRG